MVLKQMTSTDISLVSDDDTNSLIADNNETAFARFYFLTVAFSFL